MDQVSALLPVQVHPFVTCQHRKIVMNMFLMGMKALQLMRGFCCPVDKRNVLEFEFQRVLNFKLTVP